MKTAEERAAEIVRMRNGGMAWAKVPALIARHLREYARDQRQLCAEAVENCAAQWDAVDDARNAPEPGK